MWNSSRGIVVGLCALVAVALESSAGSFDPKRYEEADMNILKAAPEKLKNDRIWFETRFIKYNTTFFPYMEKSGFEAGEDFMLSVQPVTLPVTSKKTDELTELLPTLKPGTKVKLYGRVKKFRRSPKYTKMPYYYFDLEKMEPIETKTKKQTKPAKKDNDDSATSEEGGFEFKMPKDPRRRKRKY